MAENDACTCQRLVAALSNELIRASSGVEPLPAPVEGELAPGRPSDSTRGSRGVAATHPRTIYVTPAASPRPAGLESRSPNRRSLRYGEITLVKSKSIAAPSRRFRNPELHRRRHELPRVVVSRRGAALGDESLPARRDDRRVDAPGGNTPRGGSRRRRGCHVDIPNSTGGQGLATSCPSSSSRCPASAHE